MKEKLQGRDTWNSPGTVGCGWDGALYTLTYPGCLPLPLPLRHIWSPGLACSTSNTSFAPLCAAVWDSLNQLLPLFSALRSRSHSLGSDTTWLYAAKSWWGPKSWTRFTRAGRTDSYLISPVLFSLTLGVLSLPTLQEPDHLPFLPPASASALHFRGIQTHTEPTSVSSLPNVASLGRFP